MLTRFVRIQLIIFSVLSLIGVGVISVNYLQVPTFLGIGRMTVTVELASTGGLYRFANVTYRGVQVGKVTEVSVADKPPLHTTATLSLDDSVRIPTDLIAEVHSLSAIGELYVDLVPRTDSGPTLQDGSIIAISNTTVPQQIGPVLDQVNAMLGSIPKDRLNALVDDSSKAFSDAGFDFGQLIDSASSLVHDIDGVGDRTRTLIDDSAPLLDAQAATGDSIRLWARSLAGVTATLTDKDPQIRTLLQHGPAAADEVTRLLTTIKPTLPVLLANLTTIGQITVTYNAGLQQMLVLLPAYVSTIQAATPGNNATGVPAGGEFAITTGDPNPCTVGFLPPSAWRSPADTTDVDTPDGLYCKLPQDSPTAVRGVRNYPCIEHPGKRAATVQECDDPRGFQPLAVRQHITGPAPFDPNLIAQGVPADGSVTIDEHLEGPVPETPPGVVAPPQSEYAPVPPMPDAPAPAPDTAPSAFTERTASGASFAVAQYNPRTGSYLGGDGRLYSQTNLISETQSWEDLLPN